jgi:cyanophycinase-like exopeptidase
MKHMNVVRRFGAKVGGAAVGAVVLSSPVYAAIDTTAIVDEFTAAGTAAGTIIVAAMVFAGICMAGFALYRRLK